jgi:predicted chitinase
MKIVRLANILAEIGREVLLNAIPECYSYKNLLGLNVAASVKYSDLYIHKKSCYSESELKNYVISGRYSNAPQAVNTQLKRVI